jgi:uncharacterized membrane protein
VSLLDILQLVAWTIAGFGVIVIVLSAGWAFIFLSYSFLNRRLDALHRRLNVIRIREAMTNRIIFGLDFLIASDIIISTVVPNIEDIARLGGIVIIRVVLTYMISKETQELERRERWEQDHGHEPQLTQSPGKHISDK